MSRSGLGMSFLYEFDLGNANVNNPGVNVLSVSSTATGDFDKANLNSESTRERWRSANILTEQEIIIQADLASNIDTFAIIGHNLTDQAVIRLQANISNNFLAPPVSITIPWRKDNLVHLSELGSTYEYYRILILDPTNPCGFIELGRVIGGRAFTMGNCEDVTDSFSIKKNDFSEQMKTEGFFRQSNIRVKSRTLSASIRKIDSKTPNNTNFQGLRDMFDNVGKSVPLLAILDRGNADLYTAWGQFSDIPSEGFTINEYVSLNFKFNEVF